ncbi:sterile alpha motif domain-containing protein 1-like [Dipodomys merriami]|uniref:sterile alpha motif domain-containing protein 1-like n=1 Tax=Dipodomys merriami TaxID=94247 RepID=UPI003855F44E
MQLPPPRGTAQPRGRSGRGGPPRGGEGAVCTHLRGPLQARPPRSKCPPPHPRPPANRWANFSRERDAPPPTHRAFTWSCGPRPPEPQRGAVPVACLRAPGSRPRPAAAARSRQASARAADARRRPCGGRAEGAEPRLPGPRAVPALVPPPRPRAAGLGAAASPGEAHLPPPPRRAPGAPAAGGNLNRPRLRAARPPPALRGLPASAFRSPSPRGPTGPGADLQEHGGARGGDGEWAARTPAAASARPREPPRLGAATGRSCARLEGGSGCPQPGA